MANLTPAQVKAMKDLGIQYSEEAAERHLKLLFWGATSTRKTETVLRHFPSVLLIDAEGNSDQCVRNKAIPPFQRIKTTDTRRVLEVIDAAGQGLVRMPDGSPIRTLCIDSVSVLWGIQQEVASSLAEQRASRKGYASDTATVTPLDWTKAKRPLKMLLNRFAKTSIPILILIAREKDLYEEKPGGDLQKIGVVPNVVKDTEYDMNLALRFFMENGSWGYEVTKVQGALGELFPLKKKSSALPLEKLFEYTSQLQPEAREASEDDEDLPEKIATSILAETGERSQVALLRYGADHGLSAQQVGATLKEAGFTGFDPARWSEMIAALDKATPPAQ